MRRAARTDKNHSAIVNAFRGLGCSVETLHRLGDDVPDLLIGCLGTNLVVEVKNEKGKLTEGQQKWFDLWRGQVCVVRDLEEVGLLVKAVRANARMKETA